MIRKYNDNEIPTLVNIWEQSSRIAHPNKEIFRKDKYRIP